MTFYGRQSLKRMQDQARLFAITSQVRHFLEPIWLEWHRADGDIPSILSKGTCGRSSLFLQRLLEDNYGISAAWRTGNALEDCGFYQDGQWQSHSWVQAGNWILDVTADQFGENSVIVIPASSPLYKAGTDMAETSFRERRMRNVRELLNLWRAGLTS